MITASVPSHFVVGFRTVVEAPLINSILTFSSAPRLLVHFTVTVLPPATVAPDKGAVTVMNGASILKFGDCFSIAPTPAGGFFHTSFTRASVSGLASVGVVTVTFFAVAGM